MRSKIFTFDMIGKNTWSCIYNLNMSIIWLHSEVEPTYRTKIVRVIEPAIAVRAIVLPVPCSVHVFGSSLLIVVCQVASFAGKLLCPMTDSGHMLVAGVLGREGAATCFTCWPVATTVHVVGAGY